jgi:hypothetical protein
LRARDHSPIDASMQFISPSNDHHPLVCPLHLVRETLSACHMGAARRTELRARTLRPLLSLLSAEALERNVFMRMKSILLASTAVAILAVSAVSADARSKHRSKQDAKEDEITRQLNLEQLNKAGGTMQQTPATNEPSDMQQQPADQNAPQPEQPSKPPSY